MKCTYIKDNGKQCNAFAMKGTEFCYLHNPSIPEGEKIQVQSKGGKSGIKQRKDYLSELMGGSFSLL